MPRRQVVRLLTRCGLKPDDEKMIGRADGVAAGRFRVLHTVRPMRDLPVMRLVRGGQLLPARFVDEQTLIDMADRVLVCNVDGYIGDSTRREIEYAEGLGKPIEYLVALPAAPEET